MEQSIQLSVILPTYKEKDNLKVLIPQILAEFQDTVMEVIVVDDHSMDGTRELLEEMQKQHPNVILLERAGLLGIGSALRDGMNRARGEYILSSDADCSFFPSDMRAIFEQIKKGDDLVLGHRIAKGFDDPNKQGEHVFHSWMENAVLSPLSNWIIGILCGVGLKNYNTNFRVIRASMWKRIHTVEDRLFFLFETIVRVRQAGGKISELPVTFSPRQAGQSKVSFIRQAPAYMMKLLRIVFFDRPKA